MRFAERLPAALRGWRSVAAAGIAALGLAACGGSSTTTTLICAGSEPCGVVTAAEPTGDNTTEIVVDGGPPDAFALGVTNVPYVTVTVCSPGSTSRCVTIDHVLLDTGSIGLRVLKSRVAALGLQDVPVAADVASATPAGSAAECYPFVLGAVWGPLAVADLRIAGETASSLTVQLIDDDTAPVHAAPANCEASSNGGLLNTAASLEANGILGIGVINIDCGVSCLSNDYAGGYAVYYSCPAGSSACAPAGLPAASQVRNPVTLFAVNNNGALIVMPSLPELGAMVAKGRLVFGIGTQTNNQIPPEATMYLVDPDPAHASYLYIGAQVGVRNYPNSYIDTGSNAMFFEEPSLSQTCKASAGTAGGWYCPAAPWRQSATFTDVRGAQGTTAFSVTSADTLFGAGNAAFSNLAGTAGQPAETFAWGMPFFYGRKVFVSIWGQVLSPNGPWYAF
jgi:Protein of unknown function (DUF3443)